MKNFDNWLSSLGFILQILKKQWIVLFCFGLQLAVLNLLALYSRITPGRLRAHIGVPGIEAWLAAYKASILPAVLFLQSCGIFLRDSRTYLEKHFKRYF